MIAKIEQIRDIIRQIKSEPMPTGEPMESGWLGRQQVADMIDAILIKKNPYIRALEKTRIIYGEDCEQIRFFIKTANEIIEAQE